MGKKSKKEKPRQICTQCKESDAKFYSTYANEKALFCSSECHQKYDDNADTPNPMLIELAGEHKDEQEETQVSEVFNACQRGEENLQTLQSQFQLYGENPNQKNAKGQTLLSYAIAKGDVRTLDILLSVGAEIDAQDDNGDTALMVAAQLESDVKVEFLLNKGALTNAVDGEGKTALHRTEQNKTTKCAQLLIEKDPSLIHTTDKHMQTVLHLAAGEGNEELTTFLVQRGSKRDTLDNLGRAPLHWAVIQGMKGTVEMLLEGEEETALEVRDKLGFYPTHYAVQVNRPDIARILTHKGCDLKAVDFSGRTPFVYAASQGFQDMCQVLLEKELDMDSADKDGFTALHFAASRGDGALCKLLLDQGACADPTNKQGETPLHLATANEHTAAVEILVNNGSKGVTMRDDDKRTPIHNAAECDYLEILKILLRFVETPSENKSKDSEFVGVLDLRDGDKHTALYLAASREYKECSQALLEKGATVDEESRPHLIQMGLVEAPKEEKEEEEKAVEVAVEAEASVEEGEEGGGALTPQERYASTVSPPSDEPQIDLAPSTDKEVVANTSRHVSNSRGLPRKPASWQAFVTQKKRNKENMIQTNRSIPKHTGAPYLVNQVDSHVFRRLLIGHRTAHDIYSKDIPANHEKVYGGDSQSGKYSYSRSATSEKPGWRKF